MSNKITEKYFTQKDFSLKLQSALAVIIPKTKFNIQKEIWRGIIYDKDKIGSIIFAGTYKNKPAILKIQGLRPEIDEMTIFEKFQKNNKSRRIRLPKVYAGQKWNTKNKFGFLILERIPLKNIFLMPLADKKQKQMFCRFYNEYRTKTVAQAWWKNDLCTKAAVIKRLNNWTKISKHNKCWSQNIQGKRVSRFEQILNKHFEQIPLIFSHGHLSANDIFINKGKFVLMSNLFWGFRPKYYDLTFNIWACLLRLPNKTSSLQAIELIEDWRENYRRIPWVKKQNDFDAIFPIMLLERLTGSILVDLCVGRKNAKRLLRLHLQLFDYYSKDI